MVDRDLVEQAREGDREAFAVLVHQVSDSLYAVAYRILRDSVWPRTRCRTPSCSPGAVADQLVDQPVVLEDGLRPESVEPRQ